MHWIWILPAAVAVVGLGVLIGVLGRMAEELKGLRDEVRRMTDLRAEVGAVRQETTQAFARARTMRLPKVTETVRD